MDPSKYSRGDVIVFREIWDGKIWTARPSIVVQDDAELIALHMPPGMRWKRHQSIHRDRTTIGDIKNRDWVLQDCTWESAYYSHLRLIIPGESYSVLLFLNSDDSLRLWYINLEDPEAPMHHTEIGFDCTDQILDMIIEPDLKDWRWEDEDELQEAMAAGLISPAKAQSLYDKGEQVRDRIMSGKSVFNGWEHWRPDSSWKVPTLLAGWDVLR